MQSTLGRPKKMSLVSYVEASGYCVRLIEQTWRRNGEFVLLWANTRVLKDKKTYHRPLYYRLLDVLGGQANLVDCYW